MESWSRIPEHLHFNMDYGKVHEELGNPRGRRQLGATFVYCTPSSKP